MTSAYVLRVVAPSGVLRADPTQLPVVTSPGQTRHGSFTYGRSLAAGQTYTDPLSSVEVLKVTSATVPISNSGVTKGYASGGPRFSQRWIGGDSNPYYTLCLDVIDYMVDIRYDVLGASNYRDIGAAKGPGDTGMCFSLNPATPRISYYLDGTVIRRFNSATNADENATGFPKTVPGTGTNLVWLQNKIDDDWFCVVRNPGPGGTFYGYKPGTDTVVTMSSARSGGSDMDECHIDRRYPIVYMFIGAGDASANAPWYLDTDTFDLSPGNQTSSGPMQGSHTAGGYGYLVGQAHSAMGGGEFVYEGQSNVITHIIDSVAEFQTDNSDSYHNNDWVFERRGDTRADLWHITSREFQDDSPPNKVRQYMIAAVKAVGSDMRLVCHHDSGGADLYNSYAKPSLSPDGKLVAFTSDMNGTSRHDVFVAKMPVS